jgi:hypothetical protein
MALIDGVRSACEALAQLGWRELLLAVTGGTLDIAAPGERCFESELLRLKAQALGSGETAHRLLEEALAIAREQGAVALEQRVGEALAGV